MKCNVEAIQKKKKKKVPSKGSKVGNAVDQHDQHVEAETLYSNNTRQKVAELMTLKIYIWLRKGQNCERTKNRHVTFYTTPGCIFIRL